MYPLDTLSGLSAQTPRYRYRCCMRQQAASKCNERCRSVCSSKSGNKSGSKSGSCTCTEAQNANETLATLAAAVLAKTTRTTTKANATWSLDAPFYHETFLLLADRGSYSQLLAAGRWLLALGHGKSALPIAEIIALNLCY